MLQTGRIIEIRMPQAFDLGCINYNGRTLPMGLKKERRKDLDKSVF